MIAAIDRRQALLGLLRLGCTAAAVLTAKPVAALEHRAHPEAPPDAVAMLYDNTMCTGCKACMPACSEANGLPPDTKLSGGLWQTPLDLNAKTKNIIKLYHEGDVRSYYKAQCMHCVEPACASACTSPASAARSTSTSASTPGKLLPTPLSSSSGADAERPLIISASIHLATCWPTNRPAHSARRSDLPPPAQYTPKAQGCRA